MRDKAIKEVSELRNYPKAICKLVRVIKLDSRDVYGRKLNDGKLCFLKEVDLGMTIYGKNHEERKLIGPKYGHRYSSALLCYYAARVILRLPKTSSITTHLKSLHWLPVKVRSTHKIACLCYHCHSSTAPSYVTGMLHRKPLHTRNTRSSSYTMPLLNRTAHSKATLGDHSFSFASSSVWNSIPNDVRCASSLSSFKSRLKTYLFCSVYKD